MGGMIETIETAVIDRLKVHFPKMVEFDITKDFANIISWPSIAVTTEKIGFESESGFMASSFKLNPVISIYMVVKSVQPTPRRTGIYPIVEAAAALLVGQTLGLDINPLEPDGPIVEIFHEALVKTGAVAFRMNLKSGFALDTSEDSEDMTRLLSTANEYHYREWESGTQLIEYP